MMTERERNNARADALVDQFEAAVREYHITGDPMCFSAFMENGVSPPVACRLIDPMRAPPPIRPALRAMLKDWAEEFNVDCKYP